METPVAFLIFNRPEQTALVFEQIRRARPPHLLVVADGPRPDRPEDHAKCALTRAIVEKVDWPCKVDRCYSETNMGCKRRVSTGLDWVFDTVEAAIILEDDCLPHQAFFPFCEDLLQKYRDDKRIMMVSGDSFRRQSYFPGDSYYVSRYCHIWGWASWRRAWQHYDVNMTLWESVRDNGWLWNVLGSAEKVQTWTKAFDSVHSGTLDTWDHQWTLACWLQSGLSIMPAVNLVSNIGFGADATHTTGVSPLANRAARNIAFPLRHPAILIPDLSAEDLADRLHSPSLFTRALLKAQRVISGKAAGSRPKFSHAG